MNLEDVFIPSELKKNMPKSQKLGSKLEKMGNTKNNNNNIYTKYIYTYILT